MCVIAIVDDDAHRPTAADIRAMWDANHYGGGVAWRTDHASETQPDGSPTRIVHWEKGLSLEDMLDRIPQLPVPFVAHFRVPSVGGACPELCHPFPIQHGAPLWLAGDGPSPVLFHNGTWSKWDSTGMLLLARAKAKIPPPPYSDSRAMALLTHIFGPHILDIIDEKVVIFSAYDEPETFGGPWYDRHGYTVSNTYWIGRIIKEEKKETGAEKEGASKAVDTTYTVPPASMLPGIRNGGSPIDSKAEEKKESLDELRARHRAYLESARRGSSAAVPFPDWTKWTTDCPSWIIEAEFRLLTKRQLAKHETSNPFYLSKNEWKRARNQKSKLLFAIARKEICAAAQATLTGTTGASPSSTKTSSGDSPTASVRPSTSPAASSSVESADGLLREAARVLRDPRLEVATMTVH